MLDFNLPILTVFSYNSYITPPALGFLHLPFLSLKDLPPRFHMSCSLISSSFCSYDTSFETFVLSSLHFLSSFLLCLTHSIYYYLKSWALRLGHHGNPKPRRHLINICSMNKRMKCLLRNIRFLWIISKMANLYLVDVNLNFLISQVHLDFSG